MSDYFRQNSSFSSFTNNSWVVLGDIEQQIKEKIEKAGVPLKNWDVQINYGIKTGFNEAFIISAEKRDELIRKCPKADSFIRPILRGRDVEKYRANWAGLYIIGTFPSLNLNIDDYPSVKEHLLSFGFDRIKQTGDPGARKKTHNKWFETQDSISYKDDFFKQKIVWKRIGSVLRFSYDETGLFCLDSTCFATGNDMKFLVGYLNSTISKSELLNNSPKTGTGDVITSVQALEPLRIPKATEKQKNEIIALVDRCIDAQSENTASDISGFEKNIDKIVFSLFGLSEEEIDFVRLSQ